MAEEIPLSPREKWLKTQAERRLEEDRKLDRELRESFKKDGKIFTIEGAMNKEEAEKRGLKEIDFS